ncbi:MAG: RNA pyrophosphohydrolase [Alphaproteobacteria bacterium]
MNNSNKTQSLQTMYRPCVGIVLFNEDRKVFVGERIDMPGALQMPQGGIDPGETITQAAMREMLEETGTDKAQILEIAPHTIRYDLPSVLLENDKIGWNKQYRGQEQTWVAMRFTGQDTDIDLNHFSPPEFSQWHWLAFEETINRIVSFKRNVYIQVFKMFKHLTKS